ncbi:aldehyde reductase [Aureobasidium pullulans]|uniref:Aldehyde reductase n=1 Tax=Aureobasidium pullulans TaxID=5580 RepID=A0AB74J466_AURPU|nr:aldehyde reductase [Aureobasidium pullulans]THW48304.1 aldehyde reductase [Aureobasidium pullulans]TIA60939.1 aldehyde reductase [Aureobasidium pullulans]
MMHLFSSLSLAASALAAVAVQEPTHDQVPLGPSTLFQIPTLGFGTWNLKENATEAVSYAISTGYRHIDAAAIYGNEKAVGKGITEGLEKAGLTRDDLWVTSKLWNDHHAPGKVEAAIDKTLSDLNLEYLDLYHMHWPVASTKKGNEISFLDTWKAMVQLVQSGKTRRIGVSNFSPNQLDTLLNHTTHVPFAHQMELHPYLPQNDWIQYHKVRNIRVTAYSPLGGTNPTYHQKSKHMPTPLLETEVLIKIANKHNATAAQISLAWGMSRGTSVIPKSAHAARMDENLASKHIELDADDLETIDQLGRDFTFRYNDPSKSWRVKLYEGLEGV